MHRTASLVPPASACDEVLPGRRWKTCAGSRSGLRSLRLLSRVPVRSRRGCLQDLHTDACFGGHGCTTNTLLQAYARQWDFLPLADLVPVLRLILQYAVSKLHQAVRVRHGHLTGIKISAGSRRDEHCRRRRRRRWLLEASLPCLQQQWSLPHSPPPLQVYPYLHELR